MYRILTFLVAVLVLKSAMPAQDAGLRVFTNQQGQSIQARLIGVAGDKVKIARADGVEFVLPIANLSAGDQSYIRQQVVPPVTAIEASVPALNQNSQVTAEAMNEVLGMPLFSDESLWEADVNQVAQAIQLSPESETKTQASFRVYPGEKAKLFGARPYSVALYAELGKPVNVSMVFANKGDSFGAMGSGKDHFIKKAEVANAERVLKKAMDDDVAIISTKLTEKLGEPRKERFGEGKSGRMNMKRWDWQGHAILLAEAEGEYVGVQVVPLSFANAGGKSVKITDAEIRKMASDNLKSRLGGDLVIENIPMVDQGPKGYCVPATAERAMRYLGVAADMYVLANAGGSGFGGGTSVEELLMGMARHIRAKGRSYNSFRGDIKLRDMAKYIDKGIPVIWALSSTDKFNAIADRRTKERDGVSDWNAWKNKVAQEASGNHLDKDPTKAHVVLIIGYNKDTNEIAFSDSWGENFKERWISVPEANQASAGFFYVIGF